jgi:hypothetical protein
MSRTKTGRRMLTIAAVVFPVANILADWNKTHVFNPTWPAHARFHAADMSVIVWSVSAIAMWLLWRKSAEPQVGIKVAALLSLALWSPFLYLTLLVPGTSLYVGRTPPAVQHRIAGMVIEPQVVLAILFLLLTAWGYILARRGDATT